MKQLALLAMSGILFCVYGCAKKKKIAILGSSTSACYGLTGHDSCYVARLQKYYDNSGAHVSIRTFALGGYTVYKGMPSTYSPPPDRSSEAPDPAYNITAALAINPDIVLVNYPSNGYDTYSVSEILFCLRTIKQTANNAGKPCYVTTTQPRSEPSSYSTAETRRKMAALKDSVLNEFGEFAINFWDGFVNPADTTIISTFSAGDGVHLNDAGHRILFERVVAKNLIKASAQRDSPL